MQKTNKGKGIILIIDDDRMIVDLVKMAFAGDGYQVLAAQSGNELNEMLDNIDLTNETAFDLILLDLLLPDTSGEQLYQLLRANEYLVEIPIIILSAAAAVQKRIQLLKMGADDYIIKPFNVDDLLMRATVHIKLGKMRQAKNEVDSRMNLLGEIAREMNSPAEVDASLGHLLDKLTKIIQAESGDIFLTTEHFDSPAAASLKQIGGDYLSHSSLDEDSITTAVLETGEPVLLNNAAEDGRFSSDIDQPSGQETKSMLCVPLTIGSEFTCALRLFNKTAPGFTNDDLNLLVSAANIISIGLKNNFLNLLLETAN